MAKSLSTGLVLAGPEDRGKKGWGPQESQVPVHSGWRHTEEQACRGLQFGEGGSGYKGRLPAPRMCH